MEMERISKYVGNQSMSIVDAMAKIDDNSKGILLIVDDSQRLVGLCQMAISEDGF